MTTSHSSTAESNLEAQQVDGPVLEKLVAFLRERRSAPERAPDLETFEQQLHELFSAAEREAMGEELSKHDLNVPEVFVDGRRYRQVMRCEETYFASSGPVRVLRSLYREGNERTICPLELRCGMVEGRWTPQAAKQAAWSVAHMTPQEAEHMFAMLGGMKPSKSSLDRLPKQLSARWEENRKKFEQELRIAETVPAEAVSVSVSLDGVLVPMKDGQRQEKRAAAAQAGKETRGPAGYEEVGCGTISLYNAEGERLSTIRWGRMPEEKKATLKAILKDELERILGQRPDLEIVKVADGARDNWTYLSSLLPGRGYEVVDFYHVAEHLNAALTAAYGETSPTRAAQFVKLRHRLRHEDDGVEKVIRSLAHLRDQHPRSRVIAKELKYFRRNRARMRYAEVASKNLPIGSGVTEAACKTLATQRLKRSGMRWRDQGGQAVLTLRSVIQSERFERAWALLAATYEEDVELPENVVAFPRRVG